MKNLFRKAFCLLMLASLLSACGSKDVDELIVAAQHGDLDGVRERVAAGVDVDGCGSWEGCDTALIRAIEGGHTEVVAYLLLHGADVNKPKHGPLVAAGIFGHTQIARMLVEHGATIGDYPARENLRKTVAAKGDRELYALLFEQDRAPELERH